MSEERIVFTAPEQLDYWSQVHTYGGNQANDASDQWQAARATASGADGWGGAGFDHCTQFMAVWANYLQAYGGYKRGLSAAVQNCKGNLGDAESAARGALPPPKP